MKVTVYGASDDLIEVEGDLGREEYDHYGDEWAYLHFDDGTVLKCCYGPRDHQGRGWDDWCIDVERLGAGTKATLVAWDQDGGTDGQRVTLEGNFTKLPALYSSADGPTDEDIATFFEDFNLRKYDPAKLREAMRILS